MNSPKTMWLRVFALVAIASAALTSCSVSPDGPATDGASHGTLGSTDMSDYYYKKAAGWTYVFQNVQNIYANSGTISLQGANDTIKTMGFNGFAPNGDSLFRYEISYRVSSAWAGRKEIVMWYLPSTRSNRTVGAFIDGGAIIDGMVAMNKRPRPVSTDTILAGVVGRVRTLVDDFSNTGTYAWQKDTLWCSSNKDSVFIWERFYPGGPLTKSRCIFIRNFSNNVQWVYDLVNNPTTTYYAVQKANVSMTVPAGTFSNCVNIIVNTPEVDDHDFNRENKWYACGAGPIYQYDWWYVTTDGNYFTVEDFTRSLVSLTQQ